MGTDAHRQNQARLTLGCRLAKKYFALRPGYASRLKNGGRNFVALKRAALKRIKRWQRFTAPAANLNPGYFILETDQQYRTNKPGRPLRNKARGVARHGLDENGCLFVMEWGKDMTEFWQHGADRVDAITFEGRLPVLVQTLWLRDSRPEAHIFYNRYVMTIRLYGYEAEKLAYIIETCGLHHRNRQLNIRHLIPEYVRRFGIWSRRDSVDGTFGWICEQHPNTKVNTALPVLDLKKELPEIKWFIVQAMRDFAVRQKNRFAKRQTNPVGAVGLQFKSYAGGGPSEILASFDTREEFVDDGEWTHPFASALERPGWAKFWSECEKVGGAGTLVDARGTKHRLNDSSDPLRWFGLTLADALMAVSQTPAFQSVQKAKRCMLLVHDVDFAFCWRRLINVPVTEPFSVRNFSARCRGDLLSRRHKRR
jgi:hypothetical protein